jgi:CRP/FNR family transcriptional regulator
LDSQSLKDFEFFSSLKPETQNALARRAFQREITAGYNLVIEGMSAEACYFVLSGQLRVSRMNRDGRIQILARLGAGEPVNVISLLKEDRINHASVESLTDSTVLVLLANDFDEFLSHYPDFSTALLKNLAKRMAKTTSLAANLSLYTVRSRLAQFLIDLAERPQSAGGWTQDEIAAHIGTVRDVVGRLLREFESQGLIKRDRQNIILLDRKALMSEAQNDDE